MSGAEKEQSPPLPEYEAPPVVEVVCGVTFKPLERLLAPHLGLLWERFRSDYPGLREVAPLAQIIEAFEGPDVAQIELLNVPPLPRVWFLHSQETGIIQVQRDRFLHNWKQVSETDEYPRYVTVIELFRRYLAVFEQFVGENDLGAIAPVQYEMTYVNVIPHGQGWESLGEVGRVFADFAWRSTNGRFLPEPGSMNWRTAFALPNRNGRLHVTMQPAPGNADSPSALHFQLMVRGIPTDMSRSAMWSWFDLAHEWIVRGFTDLTGESMHKDVWRRTR